MTHEGAEMGKIAVKKDKSSSGAKEKNNLQHIKKQKKKKFWKNHPKIATKKAEIKPISPLLPPKKPEEFSSNWKSLQALLISEKTNTEPSPAAKSAPPPAKAAPTPSKSAVPPAKPAPTPSKSAPPPAKPASPAAKSAAPSSKPSKKEKVSKLQKQKTVHVNGQTASSSASVVKEGPTADRKPKRAAGDAETTDKRREKRMTLQAEREEKLSTYHKKKPAETNVPEVPKLDLWFDDVDPDDIEATLGPEAGQIARKMQGLPEKKYDTIDTVLVKDRAFEGLTRTVAIDCEMVGVGTDGEESIVARVSIVNQFGKCIYDKFVKPTEHVTDYRTEVSGIRPDDIKKGEDFKVVQKEVSEILKGRILVGHAVHNDLKILLLDHPKKATRDTQKYKPFRREVKSGRPSLKLLCDKILNVKVQTGEHSSVQDAQAAMRLYTMEKKNWEASIKAQYNRPKVEPKKNSQSSPE